MQKYYYLQSNFKQCFETLVKHTKIEIKSNLIFKTEFPHLYIYLISVRVPFSIFFLLQMFSIFLILQNT
jgi:hypothetical protein